MKEAIALNRQSGELWWAAWAMLFLGTSAWEHAEFELAAAALSEGEAIFTRLGASHAHSHIVLILGGVLRDRGDLVRAQRLIEESLAESRTINCLDGTAGALCYLAELNRLRGDPVLAAQQAVECLLLAHQLSYTAPLLNCVELLGGMACDQGQPQRTAILLSAAAGLRINKGVPMSPILRPAYERDLAAARTAIGANRFAAAWAEASVMTVDQVVEYARQTNAEAAVRAVEHQVATRI
jgi:hypothetical protein